MFLTLSSINSQLLQIQNLSSSFVDLFRESNPLLLHPPPRPEPESRPVSRMGTDSFDFEFPAATAVSGTVPNDVVFCGKVINRETQGLTGKMKNPFLLRSETFGRSNRAVDSVRSASTGENRWRSSRKHQSGLFGIVKFPLQMELGDMKMRQGRREPLRLPMPALTAEGGGGPGESCWDLVRPLRRRSQLMNALAKATFGCIPIV